jgi:hypothetical protein
VLANQMLWRGLNDERRVGSRGARSEQGPRLDPHHEGLTGAEAVAIMEKDLEKVFRRRECGKATAADHEALRVFELKTGKRLLRDFP